MKIRYNIVKSASIQDVIDLYKAAGWWYVDDNEQRLEKIICQSFCFLIAIDEKEKIIGMGRVISDAVSDGYIQDVFVRPEFRGFGIGKKIIRELTNYCLDHDLQWIGLIAEPNTHIFYERLGYFPLPDYQPMLFKKTINHGEAKA
jgi:GNAT superfamily N-acetyltransferase